MLTNHAVKVLPGINLQHWWPLIVQEAVSTIGWLRQTRPTKSRMRQWGKLPAFVQDTVSIASWKLTPRLLQGASRQFRLRHIGRDQHAERLVGQPAFGMSKEVCSFY